MSIHKFFRILILTFFYLIRNRKSRTVFFQSLNLKYSDHQRAISEALYKLDPSIKQVWYCMDNNVPSYIKCVTGKINVMKAMAQSKVWVLNLSFSWKPKSIFNIATWHGDRGFKKVIYDNDPIRKRDHKAIYGMDLYLSGSRFGTEVARSAFRYCGEIQETGSPRNDKLINIKLYKEDIKSIKIRLGIPVKSKILLYAPTFRDNLTTDQLIPFNYEETLKILKRNGEDWRILVRAHFGANIDTSLSDDLINVSEYPDMADLLIVSDMLITDYSSCCCDFILTERPCILLLYDEDEYKKNCREFKVTPLEAGFCIAENETELIEIIKNLDNIDFKKKTAEINEFYGTKETGHSSEDAAKRIIEWLDQTQRKQ